MATDPYAGFEVVEQSAPDPYAGFEVITDPAAKPPISEVEARRMYAEIAREEMPTGFAPIQRRIPDPEIGVTRDTLARGARSAGAGTGQIIQGIGGFVDLRSAPEKELAAAFQIDTRNPVSRAISGAGRDIELETNEFYGRGVDPSRDETLLARGAEIGGSLLPIVASRSFAPIAGGFMMGEQGARAAAQQGKSVSEVDRSRLINTVGGAGFGYLPVPGIRSAGAAADAATVNIGNEAIRQLIRRGTRVGVGGASGAAINATGDLVLQGIENGEIDLERARQNAIFGFGSGAGLGLAAGGGRRPSLQLDMPPRIPDGQLVVDMPQAPALDPVISPAQQSAQAIEVEFARQEALRRSPEGAQLLAQQLDEEAALAANAQAVRNRQILEGVRAEEAAIPPPIESPAQQSARTFEEAALQEEAIRRSPQGARGLELDLAAQQRVGDSLQLEAQRADAGLAADLAVDVPPEIRLAPQVARAVEEFDELAPQGSRSRQQRRMRLQDRRGFVDTELLTNPVSRTAGAAAIGAIAGSTQGDTIEERLRNAALGAGGAGALALAGPSVVRAAGRGAKQRPAAQPAREYRYSVFEPDYRSADGQRVVQVDDITGRADGTPAQDGNGSRSLQDRIAAEEIPPIPPEILDAIPTGTYTQDEIMALVAAQPVRRGPAPAVYAFTDELPPGAAERGITGESYKLTEDIPGHPAGSNVSRSTLEAAGYDVPPVAPEQVRRAGEPPPTPPEGEAPPPAGDDALPPPQRDINFELPPRPGLKERVKEGAKAVGKLVGRGADQVLGPIMTRINNIAPEVGRGALGRYEFNIRKKGNAYRAETNPFHETARKILRNPDDVRRLTVFLGDGHFDDAIRLLADRGRDVPELVDQAIIDFARSQAAKNDLYITAKDSGLESGEIENHYPRKVDPKQLDKFFEAIGKEKRGPIWDAVSKRAEELGIKPDDMTLEERADITNQVIRGVNFSEGGGIPGALKARGVPSIAKLDQYYLPFDEAMNSYTDSLVKAVEKRKLLGRTPGQGSEGSLGAAIERAREYGITPQNETDIQSMFQSRFGPGEKSSNKIVKAARDATTVAYLGQLKDTITQVADFVLSPGRYGIRDFVGALTNPNEISAKSIGLEQIGQEFTNKGTATKAIDKLFGAIQFKRVIEAAQNNTLNTSLRSMRRKSHTPAGIRELRAKYERAMGDEFPALLDDLQNGRVTDNTEFAAFTEITDSQPVTLSEMPQAYLDNPNGKIAYALKTYSIKQADLFRRDAIGQIIEGRKNLKSGDKVLGKEQIKRGARNMAMLAAAYTAGGAGADVVKDLISGRDIDPEEYLWTAAFRLGLLNRFDLYNLRRNGLGSMIRDKIAPAWQLADEATQFVLKGDDRILQRVPFIGDVLFDRGAGGQRRKEADRKRKAAEERKRYGR